MVFFSGIDVFKCWQHVVSVTTASQFILIYRDELEVISLQVKRTMTDSVGAKIHDLYCMDVFTLLAKFSITCLQMQKCQLVYNPVEKIVKNTTIMIEIYICY